MKIDDIFMLGINVELVSMEEFWHNTRGKGVGRNIFLGR